MTASTRRVLLVLSISLVGLVLCLGAVLYATGRWSPPTVRPVAAIGGPFRLTDQDGRMVTDRDLKGRPFLVFFGYTHCPDVCPTTLFEISEVLRRLGPDADRVRAVFITLDPERDTTSAVKEYVSNFGPHMIGLTGDPAEIAVVAKEYRVYYKRVPLEQGGYTVDHTALVYLMDKDGHFVSPFNTKRTPEAAAADLRRYL